MNSLVLKIIATLGPSSSSERVIEQMVNSGVNGFRVNFSHGNPSEWEMYARYVRRYESKYGKYIALIGDLTGRSVRVGLMSSEVYAKQCSMLRFKLSSRSSGEFIPVPVKEFFEMVDVGDLILMDDGRIALKVVSASKSEVEVKVLSPGVIKSGKAIAVRGKEIDLPALSDRDYESIKFAINHDFDYISLSYVMNGEDLRLLRKIVDEIGGEIGLIAKIETISAVRNLSEIIRESDAAVVARGDLGMHFPLEEVPWLQRCIIDCSHNFGKPVIVATQVLASMAESPAPTRAEITDIVTALAEGVDAIMLTGETAVGKYPVQAVKWLRRIIETYVDKVSYERRPPRSSDLKLNFAYSVVVLAESLNAKLAVYTKKGRTALRIAKFKPRTPFYASSSSARTLRRLSIVWGIEPLMVSAKDYGLGVDETYRRLVEEGKVESGDILVLTYGFIEEDEHTIKIRRIAG